MKNIREVTLNIGYNVRYSKIPAWSLLISLYDSNYHYILISMQKQPNYEINPFIANSRLIKSLNVSSYTVVPTQVPDVKCGKWSMLILTMQYHLKFPRYLSNKLGEVCSKGGKVDDGRLVVVVIVESQEEAGRYGEVQMVCLERGVKNIPCFSVEEARGVLEDFYWVDVS